MQFQPNGGFSRLRLAVFAKSRDLQFATPDSHRGADYFIGAGLPVCSNMAKVGLPRSCHPAMTN